MFLKNNLCPEVFFQTKKNYAFVSKYISGRRKTVFFFFGILLKCLWRWEKKLPIWIGLFNNKCIVICLLCYDAFQALWERTCSTGKQPLLVQMIVRMLVVFSLSPFISLLIIPSNLPRYTPKTFKTLSHMFFLIQLHLVNKWFWIGKKSLLFCV